MYSPTPPSPSIFFKDLMKYLVWYLSFLSGRQDSSQGAETYNQ